MLPRSLVETRENNFDEFKNQWGWSGFTTKQLKPCKAMARLVAIVANLWNVFVRLADPDAHREPVTSRPAFLNIVVLAYAFRKLLRLKPNRGPIPALIPA